MNEERYNALNTEDGRLTHDEIATGWHFCDEFDGLLVGPEMDMEWSLCTCPVPGKRVRSRHWRIGPFCVSWEPAGVVSECACWLITHRCWMYGPSRTLRQCVWEMLTQWQHDRHLVG